MKLTSIKDNVLDIIINEVTTNSKYLSEGSYRLLKNSLEKFIDINDLWETVYEHYSDEIKEVLK